MSAPDSADSGKTALDHPEGLGHSWVPQAAPYRALVLIAIAWLLTAFAYWDTAASLVQTWWRSQTYAHGFIILPISVYLAWRKRDDLRRLDPIPSATGLIFVGSATLIWIAGHAGNAQAIQQLGLILTLQALVPTLLGWQIARILLFPLAYILFAWPVGEGLVPSLQDITAWFVVKGLQLTNIPVIQEGRYIFIPHGSFEVAEACSGIRYLMAAFSLGTLFAYLSYRSTLKRVGFATLSLLVPIIANGVRAYGIVMIAYLTDMKWAVGVDHLIYGWLFFGVVMLILFGLGRLWQDPPRREGTAQASIGASPPRPGITRIWPVFGMTVLVVSAGPLYRQAVSLPDGDGSVRLDLAPSRTWSEVAPGDLDWGPRYVGADRELRMAAGSAEDRIYLYIAAYAQQRQDAEMINSENRLYDPTRWKRLSDQPIEWSLTGQARQEAHETALKGPEGQLIIWHWYEAGGVRTANAMMAKTLESTTAVLGTAAPSCVIALGALWRPGQDDPRQRLEQRAEELYKTRGAICLRGTD